MRIVAKSVYIYIMKSRVNITIDESVLQRIKVYAAKQQLSLSQVIEDYLKSLLHSQSTGKTIIDLVDELPQPELDENLDLKASYYEAQKDKYGL